MLRSYEMTRKKILFASIFLISLTSLLAQILLTRIFSVTLWYHFAFFVISLVMFGLSLGGTTLFLFKDKIVKIATEKVLYVTFLFIPLSFLPIILAAPKINLSFHSDPSTYLLLLVLFLICQLPFFLVGFLFSYLFMHLNQESGRVYCFDLIGASAGALLSVFLINCLGAVNSLILLSVISSAVLVLNSDFRKTKVPFVLLGSFIILMFVNARFDIVSIHKAKGRDISSLFAKWNSFSMVRVWGDESSSQSSPFAWAMSPAYKGPFPPKLDLDIDADAYTPITRFDGDLEKIEFIKYDVTSFAYHLANASHTLIIGPGGGRDVLAALSFGSKQIVGVEVNPIIVNDIMKDRFKTYSGGLYEHENIEVVVDDARNYIRNSKDKYDVIQASLVDTWAATNAGAYSLSENNLYTLEAIAEYISHLSDNGYLTISRWFGPNSFKLSVLFLKAAEQLGIKNPNDHIVLIKTGKVVNHIFKKTPFQNAELNKVAQLASQLQFEVLYAPHDNIQNEYHLILKSERIDEFINSRSGIYLQPPTDDSPFFFNKVRFTSIPSVLAGMTKDVGIFLLYGLFIISVLLSILLIIIPLLCNRGDVFQNHTKTKLLFLAFFSILGLAFMLIEVSFLQKFMLFLGHPIYSITVVISSLLIFAGIGSFLTTKIAETKLNASLKVILLVLTGLVFVYNLSLYPLFNQLLGLGIEFRILISVLLIGVIGLFLGMPFPIGIKLLGKEHRSLIPFCWSLNGVFSVLGSILAVILAMNVGFTKTIWMATGLYGTALAIAGFLKVGNLSRLQAGMKAKAD
jgi:predicted membrane-bound spermidine synthase